MEVVEIVDHLLDRYDGALGREDSFLLNADRYALVCGLPVEPSP